MTELIEHTTDTGTPAKSRGSSSDGGQKKLGFVIAPNGAKLEILENALLRLVPDLRTRVQLNCTALLEEARELTHRVVPSDVGRVAFIALYVTPETIDDYFHFCCSLLELYANSANCERRELRMFMAGMMPFTSTGQLCISRKNHQKWDSFLDLYMQDDETATDIRQFFENPHADPMTDSINMLGVIFRMRVGFYDGF